MFIGIGMGIPFQDNGINWSSYWETQSEVLFLGLYSEIAGGKMPNKVTGATDYLTVAGAAGSETYTVPNTLPYLNSDEDYIWFKVDDNSVRTVTTTELIGYDFRRTIVFYDDAAPNAIVAIMILRGGEVLSEAQEQRMRTDFHLSIWWDGTLSLYGNLKDNRTAGRNVWIETEVVTYLTGIATPVSEEQINLINTFVQDLKSGLTIESLSDFFDTVWIIGGETKETSYKNLVKDAHHITTAAEPTWTALEGSRGNGSSQFLNTNYNPSTDGENFLQNNASFGCYIRTNINEDRADMGVISDSGGGNYTALKLTSRSIDNINYSRINMKSADNMNFSSTDSRGMYIITRNGTLYTDVTIYKNKTAPSISRTGTTSSYAKPNLNVYLCAVNEAGTAREFSTKQISFVYFGKHCTTAQRDVIVDAIEAYMDANGKGII